MTHIVQTALASAALASAVLAAPLAHAQERLANPVTTAVTASAELTANAADALLRFTNGMDNDDGDLIASSFTDDAMVDFTPAAGKVGMQFPVIEGRDNLVSALVPFAAQFTTSHSVSNIRVMEDGDKARLYALVEAQHLPEGERDRNFMMKNVYDLTLVLDGDDATGRTWLIERMVIDNLWADGDVGVMTGS